MVKKKQAVVEIIEDDSDDDSETLRDSELEGSDIEEEDEEAPEDEEEEEVEATASTSADADLPDFKAMMKGIVETVGAGNDLPKLGDKYEVLASYKEFSSFVNSEGRWVFDQLRKLIRASDIGVRLPTYTMDGDEQMDRLIDANDAIIERIGNSLDEADGLRKPVSGAAPVLVSSTLQRDGGGNVAMWNRDVVGAAGDSEKRSTDASAAASPALADTRARPIRLLAARNVVRPQLAFADTINNRNEPFLCKLKQKHNPCLGSAGNIEIIDADIDVKMEEHSEDFEVDQHPYRREIATFDPVQEQLRAPDGEISRPPSPEDTQLVMISTTEQLHDLCTKLKKEVDFAVDLEHHSYRTFLGLTCLMQITTRDGTDYIVDTLALWRELHILNEVFSDPTIVKVFHGADWDVQWLQRDFGIYIVNLFDTCQAMRALGFPRLSLQHLIAHYVQLTISKEFQLADWRIRPLPEEMLSYARSDTHYLLYCYDRLRQDLAARSGDSVNLIHSVVDRCREIALKHYEKPLLTADAHLRLVERLSRRTINRRQMYCLRRLYEWRDGVARDEDESVAYVLPDHMLVQIATVLPREAHGVLACCNPIPPLVKRELQGLHHIVFQATQMAVEQIPTDQSLEDTAESSPPIGQPMLHELLSCPHDRTHSTEHDDLAIIVRKQAESMPSKTQAEKFMKSAPALLLFGRTQQNKKQMSSLDTPLTPFEQYKLGLKLRKEKEKQQELENAVPQAKEQKEEVEVLDTDPLLEPISRRVPQQQRSRKRKSGTKHEQYNYVAPEEPSTSKPQIDAIGGEGETEYDFEGARKKLLESKTVFGHLASKMAKGVRAVAGKKKGYDMKKAGKKHKIEDQAAEASPMPGEAKKNFRGIKRRRKEGKSMTYAAAKHQADLG